MDVSEKRRPSIPGGEAGDRAVERDRAAMAGGALGCAIVVSVFAYYVLQLNPGPYWADSGELALGAFLLDNAHAPSFPLYALWVKAFTFLPFGDIGFRISLASAGFFSLAAALLFGIVASIEGDEHAARNTPSGNHGRDERTASCPESRSRLPLAASISALVLTLNPASWLSSVRAEVYTLNLFVVLLLMAVCLQWGKRADLRWVVASAFIFGLGLGNHSLLVLVTFPPIAAYLLLVRPRPILRGRSVSALLWAFLLGWSIYLYLPIRSSTYPFMDWNTPRHLEGFLDSFTKRNEIHLFVADDGFLANFGRFTASWLGSVSPWLAVLAFVGVAPLVRRGRLRALLILGFGLFNLIPVVVPPGYSWDNPDLPGYTLPAYAIDALLIGLACRRLASSFLGAKGLRRAVAWVLVPGAVAYAARHVDIARIPAADDDRARVFGRIHLEHAPLGAVAMTKSDPVTFLMWYLQEVEGRRPDVIVVNRKGLLDSAYIGALARRAPDLFAPNPSPVSLPPPRDEDRFLDDARRRVLNAQAFAEEIHAWMERLLGRRPVIWEAGSGNAWLKPHMRPRGPWFEVLPIPVTFDLDVHERNAAFIRSFLARMRVRLEARDPRATRAVTIVARNLANALWRDEPAPPRVRADVFRAIWLYNPLQRPLGILAAEEYLGAEDAPSAIALFGRLLTDSPFPPHLWAGLAEAYVLHGERGKALAALRQGLSYFPQNDELAQLLKKLSDEP